MKAAIINSENIVVNIIVWDDTCEAPEGTTAIILEKNISVSPGWVWIEGTTFENLNPPPEPEPEPEPEPLTTQQKLEAAGLSIEELKGLLGL